MRYDHGDFGPRKEQSRRCVAHREGVALDRGLKRLALRQEIASIFFDVLSRDKKISFKFKEDCLRTMDPTVTVEFGVVCHFTEYDFRVVFVAGWPGTKRRRATLDCLNVRAFKSTPSPGYHFRPFFEYSCPIAHMGNMRKNALNLHKKMLAEPLYNVLET